jgi:hypothetical protein
VCFFSTTKTVERKYFSFHSTEKGADLGSEGTDRDGNRKARGDVSSREGLVRNLTSNKPKNQ